MSGSPNSSGYQATFPEMSEPFSHSPHGKMLQIFHQSKGWPFTLDPPYQTRWLRSKWLRSNLLVKSHAPHVTKKETARGGFIRSQKTSAPFRIPKN